MVHFEILIEIVYLCCYFFSEDEVLETPIFKTMEPGEPLHHNKKLRWDHKVSQKHN